MSLSHLSPDWSRDRSFKFESVKDRNLCSLGDWIGDLSLLDTLGSSMALYWGYIMLLNYSC